MNYYPAYTVALVMKLFAVSFASGQSSAKFRLGAAACAFAGFLCSGFLWSPALTS